jgi:anthranilate phosphoribosyltransferase
MIATFTLREALVRLIEGRHLSTEEMTWIVGEIMEGRVTPAQIGALLTALRMKGETVGEVVGAALAMRERMVVVPTQESVLLDTCGTGGDGSGSVNVSTLASILVAACGVKVAKHGNRALSSRSGSHDVIEALGIHPSPGPEAAAECLSKTGICFLYAPSYHAATKHAAGPRRELGFRTLWNLLGPLTNPAKATYHINGVFSRDRCEFLARALGQLGSRRAMVVHGEGGLDEFAPRGKTFVAELKDGVVSTYETTPRDFGLDEEDPVGLLGGEPTHNAHLFLDTLRGRPGAGRTTALMTAAAGLFVVGKVTTIRAGVNLAAQALDGGQALALIDTLKRISPALGIP